MQNGVKSPKKCAKNVQKCAKMCIFEKIEKMCKKCAKMCKNVQHIFPPPCCNSDGLPPPSHCRMTTNLQRMTRGVVTEMANLQRMTTPRKTNLQRMTTPWS